MDCGIPYCHNGCPVNNQIPDWNDLVYQGDWKTAAANLHSTNNFPEVTGRICPAPCEASCTLNIDDTPVTIKTIECSIADRALERRLGRAASRRRRRPASRSPSSAPVLLDLAAAQQLARAGHDVHVYEKNDEAGRAPGLRHPRLQDGERDHRAPREADGGRGRHVPLQHAGRRDVSANELKSKYDAVLLAIGSEQPFDFFARTPGRDLAGIHYAMDFLPQQNRRVSEEPQRPKTHEISAKGKHVIVIGGGDTGSDCIGTSFRQGALSVTQLEIMPKPPEKEKKDLSWPHWPLKLRVSSSQAEGAKVEYSISTTGFAGKDGKVEKLLFTRVDDKLQPVKGSEGELKADLVLFAMGFSGPIEGDVVKEFGLEVVPRGRFKGLDANEKDYRLPGSKKLFAAGDIRRGQSLVVWAIREGRQAAHSIDKLLMGKTTLPR